VEKPGATVAADAKVRLLDDDQRYVSRGGVKLEHALKHWKIDVRGKICMDVGASTGGFTDCLLQHGAAGVIAVDTGYGQMDARLRNDARVHLLERTNARYLNAGYLKDEQLPEAAAFLAIDVSFISLKLILSQVKTLLIPSGEIIALIKPQFEVGKGKVGKGGVVRSHEEHARVIDEIKTAAKQLGFTVLGVTESPLLGPKGNKEFLIHLAQN